MLQELYTWLQANASWLQVAAAIAQAFAAVAAIPVAFVAAYWSAGRNARQAFELTEKREKKKLADQIALLRFLLGLEIQSNFDELRRFHNTFPMNLDSEGDLETSEEKGRVNTEKQGPPDTARRFIALYLPDLSYRFWHNQQLSSLLPIALKRAEIHRINLIYSNFDRLLKIRTVLGETLGQREYASFPPSAERVLGAPLMSPSGSELEDLLGEFDTIIRNTLDRDNPLKDAIEENGGEQYILKAASNSQSGSRFGFIKGLGIGRSK